MMKKNLFLVLFSLVSTALLISLLFVPFKFHNADNGNGIFFSKKLAPPPRDEKLAIGWGEEFAEMVRNKANMKMKIYIRSYVSHSVGLNSDVVERGDSGLVFIDKQMLKNFPDDALRAIIAHEMGHLYYGHTRGSLLILWKNKQFRKKAQAQADAFAIKFAGKNAVLNSFKMLDLNEDEIVKRFALAEKELNSIDF